MVVLYLGDCLEKMKSISDKSVDLIICDLPFGCLVGGGGKEKTKRKNNKDKNKKRRSNILLKVSRRKCFRYYLIKKDLSNK